MHIVAGSDARYFCIKKQKLLKNRPEALTHSVFDTIFRISALLEMDEETRDKILENMTTERDLSNQMAYAIQVGREEGIEKGMAEGLEQGMAEGIKEGSYAKSVEIAKRLKEMGMPVSDIVSATGLDSDKVSEL